MNYQEFCDLWHKALKAARLQIPYPVVLTEKIDLTNMSRLYELILYRGSHPKSDLIAGLPYGKVYPLPGLTQLRPSD